MCANTKDMPAQAQAPHVDAQKMFPRHSSKTRSRVQLRQDWRSAAVQGTIISALGSAWRSCTTLVPLTLLATLQRNCAINFGKMMKMQHMGSRSHHSAFSHIGL